MTFNRLGTEKSHIEGLGLGLALVKQLALLQGGEVGFDSEPNRTRFWVDRPAGG